MAQKINPLSFRDLNNYEDSSCQQQVYKRSSLPYVLEEYRRIRSFIVRFFENFNLVLHSFKYVKTSQGVAQISIKYIHLQHRSDKGSIKLLKVSTLENAFLYSFSKFFTSTPLLISFINLDKGNAIVNLSSGKSYHTKLFIFTDSKNKFIHNFNKTDLIKKPFDQTALSIDANVKRSNQNTAYQFFTKDGPLALLPVNNQRCSFVWSIKDNSEILEYTKEQIEKEIYKYAHMYIDELNIHSINKHKLVFSFNKNMTYKNIIMLGESVHTVHPIAGQGFNLTLKDISTLYSVLDRYLSLGYELNHKFIFNDFYKQRIPDNTLFSFSTMFMNDAFISKNNFINKSIETSFKILNRVPLIKKKIMKVASGREIF